MNNENDFNSVTPDVTENNGSEPIAENTNSVNPEITEKAVREEINTEVNDIVENKSADGEASHEETPTAPTSEEVRTAVNEAPGAETREVPEHEASYSFDARRDVPNNGVPEFGAPQYRAPQQGAPQYGAPQGGIPQYGAPQGGYNGRPNGAYTHEYSGPTVNRNGISYNPVPPVPVKEKKKNGGISAGGVAVLVVVTILLATACGFFGSYLSGVVFDTPSKGSKVEYNGDISGEGTPLVIEKTTPSSEGTDNTYADVAATVADTVVSVSTEYKVTSIWGQYVTGGAGSGVIISADGYIVTNNHVICGSDNYTVADTISVTLKDSDEKYTATVIGRDADADIALIKIDAKDLNFATFGDSDSLVVGEEVMAIGNPLGELSGTVTNGIISALAREIDIEGTKMNLLQTNTAINPGNSGGGLFNMKGELVGIVNAKSSGTGIEGLGFAIPGNDAYETIKDLKEHGYVTGRPMVGITLVDINSSQLAMYYNVKNLGVYISSVTEGCNDDVLKVGDRIVSVNDTEISSSDDVISAVKASNVGDTLEFTVVRDGKTIDVTVKCYESKNSLEFE